MRGILWLVTPVALAALVAGCSSDEARPRIGPSPSTSPSTSRAPKTFQSAAEKAIAQARTATVAAFVDQAKSIDRGRVRPGFSLEEVQYTSPTDAAATFYDCGKAYKRVCTTVIATTRDNWDRAAGLYIPDTLADLVLYMPLGEGAVAIKAEDQFREKSYPPFVLYPDGKWKPLRIAEPRFPDAGSDLIDVCYNGDFSDEAGLDAGLHDGTWAADVDAGEVFGLPGSPGGCLYEDVPGRGGAAVSVDYNAVDAGVWRFAETIDNGRSWRQTEVRLPRAGKPLRRYGYNGDYREAVGPGKSQAIAMADAPQDLPLYLRQLWRTDDEKTFRRVPLPWKQLAFGGMAFASDGALLLAETKGPPSLCTGGICHPGRIWRLPPGNSKFKPLTDAPRLSRALRMDSLGPSRGGIMIARTGTRTIAISEDGYTWTKVSPGR